MKHLYKNLCHDESQVWCEAAGYTEPTEDIGKTTCQECLRAVKRAGWAATMRLMKIIGKDWNACPYESHAADCDCGGQGGDR